MGSSVVIGDGERMRGVAREEDRDGEESGVGVEKDVRKDGERDDWR